MIRSTSSGFISIHVIIFSVVILGLLGFTGWRIYTLKHKHSEQKLADSKSNGEMTGTVTKCIEPEVQTATEEGPDGNIRSELLKLKPGQPVKTQILPRRENARFNFQKQGNKYTYKLIAPSGRTITDRTDEYDVKVEENSSIEFYTIYHPEAGAWRLEATGNGSGYGELYVFQEDILNKLPKAIIAKPVQIDAEGLKYRFDASSSFDPDGTLNPDGFTWDFGDGFAGRGKLVEHTFALDGSCKIRLRVVDSQAEFSETTALVIIPKQP